MHYIYVMDTPCMYIHAQVAMSRTCHMMYFQEIVPYLLYLMGYPIMHQEIVPYLLYLMGYPIMHQEMYRKS